MMAHRVVCLNLDAIKLRLGRGFGHYRFAEPDRLPPSRPEPYWLPEELAVAAEPVQDAYRLGWSHGHGLAAQCVPKAGETHFAEPFGTVRVNHDDDIQEAREIHYELAWAAHDHSRQFSPFEFTAAEFNRSGLAEDLWTAYEQGVGDAIWADCLTYDATDYGLNG